MKLKKWLLGLVTFAAMVVLCAVCAGAETYDYGDFKYSMLYDGTVVITGYNGSAEKVDIPEMIDGKSVTSIGRRAFEDCISLTSIMIPDSVTDIYGGAFSGCTSLTAINVVTGNQNYVSVNGVLYNKDKTAIICYPAGKKDKNFKIPDSVTKIADSAFDCCTSLTSITIPDSAMSIDDGAFSGCSSLTSITIPDGVTSIDDSTFSNCTSLKSITIPDSVTSIGNSAFWGCSSLTSITIPDGVTSIDDSTFRNCTSLKSITIPNSVISIGENAFNDCISLTSIIMSDCVTMIGDQAFYDCVSLKSVSIPDSVTEIGTYSFGYYSDNDTKEIKRVDSFKINYVKNSWGHFYATKNNFSDETCLITKELKDGTLEIDKYAGNDKNYIIPAIIDGKKVTQIGFSAFGYSADLLETVTIPDGVLDINDMAFEGCTSLVSVTIPSSVTSIGDFAFIDCSSLTEIKVASENSNYVSVNGALYNKDKTTIICYPAGKKDKNFKIPDGVTSIGNYAFRGHASLTSITIPDSMTVIDGYAFEGCTNLTSITIPDSVTSIGYYAFKDCTSLTSITIPDSVTEIGSDVFQGCTRLASITIPNSVTSIGNFAFQGCTSLASITIPKSVTSIGYCALGYYINNSYKKINNFKIYCYSGTAGEQYAKAYDFAYELLDKPTIANVTGFKVKSLTSTNVTLQWNKNSAASGYEIEQYKGGKWVNVAKITDNATTSYTVKGLAAGTAGYKFRMRAVNDGVYSDYTSTLTVNTNPYGVGGFKTKSISSTSVTLQWNKGTTASGYELQQYKNGKWVTIYTGTKATNTSYTVKNLKAGTAGYRFRIRAYKTYGNTKQYGSWSSEVKVNTNPHGVGGFKCISKSSTSVTLKWNKGTTASGYELQQYKNGKWVTIYTGTKATNTSYTVKNLKAGTAGYRFKIRAYKTYGSTKQYSSWSSEVKVNTNPYGVGGFKCSSKSSTSVTLKWNKGTTASGYQLQQYKNGKWVTIYTGTKATNTSYTVKNLKAGTAGYRFKIRAYKTYGSTKQYSSWSSEIKVNTNPYGVSGFKCSSKTSTSVTLKWNKGTTASGYQLQQYKNGKWVTIYTGTKATNTSNTIKNLKAGTAGYRFRIRAYKTYGSTKQYSSWSSEVKVNTNPYGVGGFKAKSTAKTSVKLGWNKGTTASGYQLQQYKNGKWVTVYTGTKATSTSYTVKSLKANTSYKFRIRAYKTYGSTKQYSSWGKTLTVKTKK